MEFIGWILFIGLSVLIIVIKTKADDERAERMADKVKEKIKRQEP